MPVMFAASRPATAGLAQIRDLHPNSCINLHRPTQIGTTKATSSGAATSSANALDTAASDHTPHPPRSNLHSAAPPHVPLPAVSTLGGFRTPAARARGTLRRGRHPKTFTKCEILGTSKCFPLYLRKRPYLCTQRSAGQGPEPTSRPLSRMPATDVVLSKSCRPDRAEVSLSAAAIPATNHFDWTAQSGLAKF
jgi:hypothetical protein